MDAQTCAPAQPFPDSLIALPPSWSDARPTAGIQDTACIGQYFEFTLSLKSPGAIPGFPVTINSISMPVSNGVMNLPAGMSYVCNPPNCVFPTDSLACVKIFGTPTNPADVGQKDLTLSLTINSNIGPIPINYPNQTLDPGGHYYLHVKAAGSTGCFEPSSTRDLSGSIKEMKSFPNPTTGFFVIVPQDEIMMTDMTVEEAFKMVISGGIVSPAGLDGRLYPRQHGDAALVGDDGECLDEWD